MMLCILFVLFINKLYRLSVAESVCFDLDVVG